MKKFYLIKIFLYLIFVLGAFDRNVVHSEKDNDIFKEILHQTKSEVVEYGLKIKFTTSYEGEKECVDILSRLELTNHAQGSPGILKSDRSYSIDFKTDELSGYIQYTKYQDYGIITIDVLEHKSSLALEELKHRVERAVSRKEEELKYFQYVKARTELRDTVYAKALIVDVLKKNGADNIETVELERGSSTTAFTGRYEQMKSAKGLVDFNCAVYSYESGNYVIIGTPIIMTSY